MKKIKNFFTHPVTIALLGLLLISLLIWFAGPLIKFGENNTAPLASPVVRLGIIMVLLVLWGLNNLRVQAKANKQNAELVEDLAKNQEEEKKSAANDQAAEEIRQMNQRFSQALGTLKKLKFSGGRSNKALYELPWYIIVGPPGSGKTTALVNSGLDFPLAEQFGKGAVQGVGGTRNCDWWFTNDAVLIDTAGRYTTQDSHRVVDSSAWEGFLNLLKRNRKRRPINGAIVAISLHDLLLQTEEERIQHAKVIRSRLDELMEKLEIRFPIYLMFTKADLVSGFSEFYEDLGKEEREQVWGVSLPNAPKLTQSPEFDYMNEELDKLIGRLYDRVLWKVHQERDVKRRALVQGFPQQMENLKSIVDAFVRQTFIKNRYRFQPYLRGVYFSSGTQDGTPIDRLMTSVSSNFGFSREVAQSPYQQGKSYFLGRLFREVIFPEAELVGANVRYEAMIRWAQRATLVGLSVVTVVLVLVWSGSITRHKMFMSNVNDFIAEFNAENKRLSPWNKDIRAVLPPLNALANASIVYDQEEHPWLAGMGMYDGRVDHEADKAYETYLKKLLFPKLIESIEEQLKRGHEGGDLYSTFRIYMMFDKMENMDVQMVTNWFEERWEQQFHGEATRKQELEAHLHALMALDLEENRPELNKSLIASTRGLLMRVPVSQRVYSRLKTNPEYLQKVDLRTQLGESVTSVFKMTPEAEDALSIPLLYTIEGYENTDFSVESPVVSGVVNERWVLADDDSERVDFVKDDLNEISEKAKDHYLSDYTKVWTKYYQAMEVAPFKNLNHANDVLSLFVDPVYSPFIALLQVGKGNTLLTPIPEIQHTEKIENANYRLRHFGAASEFANSKLPITKVDRRFKDVNALLKASSQGGAPIDRILAKVQEVQIYIQDITTAPDPAMQAFNIAKGRYSGGAGNPITNLREYAKKTPPEIRGWLTTLADESWKVVMRSANGYVNAEWRTRVYEPYSRALAGRYPLNKSSQDELALYDFSEFFKPGGTVDLFYAEILQPFVNTRKDWSNRVVDGYSMGFSESSIKQIRRALNIKNVFFRENPETPSISLELRPYALGESEARFTLDIGDTRLTYNHGPKFWKAITWSGADENKRVRIVFEDLDERTRDMSYNGPWAWFRLMDDSRVERTSQSNVYRITFKLKEDANDELHQITYEGKAKSINNPFSNNLLAAFRCPDKI
ncbi:type VI secretion system membrane subunit TssM [Teredinibacter sp. KSP-S5-2]|uniref:type VI secretion system membrane subunit TssM n=1 Tax=Teredinibacter sp. KSP-S5-2 TaxID=3034506 RepID=UPI0029351E95|nr:type VI secretion system membrane subunit TssM [Teredinibacter sp. KSP-S5-2]WNO08064.1 type VI secretion system membrane subunit TssM [Teredinibacter sp. KSP-S5-2]